MAQAEFYCLDLARLPDELFKPSVPGKAWLDRVTTAGAEGFSDGSLARLGPVSWFVWLERSVTYPVYMLLNAAPFAVPPVLYFTTGWKGMLCFLLSMGAIHGVCELLDPMGDIRSGQFFYTERNIQKYHSMRWVWPKSLQPPNNHPGPKIFCAIPHGLAPVGVVGYPFWSKLFEERLCRWTCAPVVLKLPVISYFLRKVGFVAASASKIREVLTKKEQSVGVVLDGIAGMFQIAGDYEKGFVRERKGIVKIALTTGTPLVPVYCFGTTGLWRIVVDPFGWLERISLYLNVSVTPFFGRPFGLLPFGPPYRKPVLTAIGNPIIVPKVENPSVEQINEYHQKLMDGFVEVFDTHKAAFGWQSKHLRLV